jgi:hypothetical protein
MPVRVTPVFWIVCARRAIPCADTYAVLHRRDRSRIPRSSSTTLGPRESRASHLSLAAGSSGGEPRHEERDQRLAQGALKGPLSSAPTSTREGNATGAPHRKAI